MLQTSSAFSGFSVHDIDEAKKFYADVLGLSVVETAMGIELHTIGNNPIFVYEKTDHTPASFTILNFPVENIDEAVDELMAKGVVFEHYDDMGNGAATDQKGVLRGLQANMGPDIAWFKDPSNNIFSILQN